MRRGNRIVLFVLTCVTLSSLPATYAAAELPPEILADRYIMEAEQRQADQDYDGAFRMMQKIVALQKEYNMKLPDDFHFKYAKVAFTADSLKIAYEAVNRYLSATGKSGVLQGGAGVADRGGRG